MPKCICGDKDCKSELYVSSVSSTDRWVFLKVVNKDGVEDTVTLDPNGAVALIQDLKDNLKEMIDC